LLHLSISSQGLVYCGLLSGLIELRVSDAGFVRSPKRDTARVGDLPKQVSPTYRIFSNNNHHHRTHNLSNHLLCSEL